MRLIFVEPSAVRERQGLKSLLEYHVPAYTGLPPQKIEDGGDE